MKYYNSDDEDCYKKWHDSGDNQSCHFHECDNFADKSNKAPRNSPSLFNIFMIVAIMVIGFDHLTVKNQLLVLMKEKMEMENSKEIVGLESQDFLSDSSVDLAELRKSIGNGGAIFDGLQIDSVEMADKPQKGKFLQKLESIFTRINAILKRLEELEKRQEAKTK